ncbi:hypothetical protein HMPREF0650_2400 [Hoylesella buccalis ATCC 35310]|uniref:Uncharacterized protein n=1 Tax=Hoylesella buccalis ATCC 35310 TaxID=679190 RepID=D1W7A9_9BACT|nr:hypothetical protein HMPREF0650_2400 [Hoylesella buccalis ATCC 35310]
MHACKINSVINDFCSHIFYDWENNPVSQLGFCHLKTQNG